jgi:hypothetical protein
VAGNGLKVLTLFVPTIGTVLCTAMTAWASVQVAEIPAQAGKAQAVADGAANVAEAVASNQGGGRAAPPVEVKVKELKAIQAKPTGDFRKVFRPF